MIRLVIGLIRFYQRFISAWLPPVCRFHPSCSEYAVQALRTHGAWVGARLAVRRLLSCHPFHPGGYDPVPPSALGSAADTPEDGARRPQSKGQMCR